MKKILVQLITLYQKTISPDRGFFVRSRVLNSNTCTFYPSCSDYFKEAVLKHGVFRGTLLGVRRIARCHPWQRKHLDPVPK